MTTDTLIRHHVNHRSELFIPQNNDSPIPLKYLDVMRHTQTNLDDLSDFSIRDLWTTAEEHISLNDSWIGSTTFHLRKPEPPKGHKWVAGRLTKVQQTTRPDNIWPEIWTTMSKRQQGIAIRDWGIESKLREEARRTRDLPIINGLELDD